MRCVANIEFKVLAPFMGFLSSSWWFDENLKNLMDSNLIKSESNFFCLKIYYHSA